MSFMIETSARHIHLTQETLEKLFGEGYELTVRKPLSYPGQFASNERLTVVGPKKEMANVSILGPVRKMDQIELSATDARTLGIDAQRAGIGGGQLDLIHLTHGTQDGHVGHLLLGAHHGQTLVAGELAGIGQGLADGEFIALTEQLLQRLLGQVNVTGRRFDHKRHGFFLLIVEHWSTMKIVPQHAPYNDASKQDADATQHRHRPLHAPDGPGKAHAPPHRHKDGPHPAHAGDDPQQAENTQHQRLVQVEAAGLPVPRQHGDEQTDPCAVADDICGALIHRSHPFPYAIWHCSTFSPVFQETGRYKFPCNPVKICYNDSILHQ